METPNNKAGEITEKIMWNFSYFNKERIIDIPKGSYNEIYEIVYHILENQFKS